MSQEIINVGTSANDNTGDTLRSSQQKANANFTELYARPVGGSQNLQQVLDISGDASGNGLIVHLGTNGDGTLDITNQVGGAGTNAFTVAIDTGAVALVAQNATNNKTAKVLIDDSQKVRIVEIDASNSTNISIATPISNSALLFPAKPVGSYTLATLDDITPQGKVVISDETGSAFTDLATALAWMATQTGAVITNGSFDSGIFRFDVPAGSNVGDSFCSDPLINIQFEDKFSLFTTFGNNCFVKNTRNNIIGNVTTGSSFLANSTGNNTIKKLVNVGTSFAGNASGRLFIESFGTGLPTDIITTAYNLVVVTPYANKFINAGSPDPAIATILANISGNAKFVYEDIGGGVPYTGATANLDLGAHNLIAAKIGNVPAGLYTEFDAENGFTKFFAYNVLSNYFDGSGAFICKDVNGTNKNVGFAFINPLTDNRIIEIPDLDGKLALIGGQNVGSFDVNGTITTGGYTVATLPTGVIGKKAYVTDALAPTPYATVVGGGAVIIPVFFDGTNWICN